MAKYEKYIIIKTKSFNKSKIKKLSWTTHTSNLQLSLVSVWRPHSSNSTMLSGDVYICVCVCSITVTRLSQSTHAQEFLLPADLNWKQIKERARGEDKRGWGIGMKITRNLQPADALHITHESLRSSSRHFDVNHKSHSWCQIHKIKEIHI